MKHAAWIAAVLLMTQPVAAQTYPTKPIRLVSPNPPGGANDTLSRIMAAKMAGILGAKIVIDNRGGAGGQIGGEIVARAAPDGYTLLMGSVSTHSFAPITSPKIPYDPIADFAPISMFAVVQNVLVVNSSLPVKNVQDLIALGKKAPGTLKYASGGVGSTSHFAVAMFVSAAGISKETLHLPYKGGARVDDRHHEQRDPVLSRTHSRHGPANPGRQGPGHRHHRRPTLVEPAGCPDAGGARACQRGVLGLVRPLAPAGTPNADHRHASPGGRRQRPRIPTC